MIKYLKENFEMYKIVAKAVSTVVGLFASTIGMALLGGWLY